MCHSRAVAALIALSVFATCACAQPGTAPTKAARSVHLSYPSPDSTLFYNEAAVERSTAGSYFMVAGFNHGYFGIQELKAGEGRVLFSVWDPTKGDNANAVPLEQRVEVLGQSPDVTVKRFGGEGTGAQSFFAYAWKPNVTYKFLVHASVAGSKTAYSGYFFVPETRSWKHLATFRVTTGGEHLQGLYSFVEDFRRDTASAGEVRRARFGNGWVRDVKGQWQSLVKARFTASSAAWEAKDSIDAGLNRGEFYLQTGGDTRASNALQTIIERPLVDAKPPAGLPAATKAAGS